MAKSRSLLCVTVRAHSISEFRRKIKLAEKKADVIEIYLEQSVDFEKIRMMTPKPLLAKGKNIKVLVEAIEKGADLIDAPLEIAPRLMKKIAESRKSGGTSEINFKAKRSSKPARPTIIISYHNFQNTPPLEKLWKIFQKAEKHGADIVKIATTARNVEDNLTIFNILVKVRHQSKTPCIAVCMGERGRLSRELAPEFGSYMSYVAVDRVSVTGKGMGVVES